MPGSIRQKRRPGVWELRVFLGRDANGRTQHRNYTFHGTKREASRELARLVTEVHEAEGDVILDWGPSTTVNEAVEGWQRNGWADLSPSTVRRYESIWKVHVRDAIGRRAIRSLGPYDVECFLRDLKRNGQSEASVRQIRAFLHRACRLARKWSGNRLPNPVSGTELPEWSLKEQREDVRSPEPDEVRAILGAARQHDLRMAAFVRMVAATGARRGEACALRWSDVDMTAGAVRFDEAVVADRGGATVKGPKNRKSIRTVAVDPTTLAWLAELRSKQEAIAAACDQALPAGAFLFATEPSGTAPPHPDTMSHAFAHIRALAGSATDVHLHSLRHFQSTQLDPVISEAQKQARLGWATVQMARHYTDVVSDEDRRAAAHMEALLGSSPRVAAGKVRRSSKPAS